MNRHRIPAAAAAMALLVLACACAHVRPGEDVRAGAAPSPAVPWTPPAQASQAPETPPAPPIPENWTKGNTILSLPEILDLALRNNPSTRAAWFQARAAAADLGSKRSEYFPEIDLGGNLTRQKSTTNFPPRTTYFLTTYGPTATLSLLLIDFGGRSGDVEEARQALYSANWTHDAAIQNVVLLVEQAYYEYLNAKGLRDAAGASLNEAQTSYDSAQGRHDAGVSTIADVLQARTALSQAKLSLETVAGQIQTIRGALATALGLPASAANLPVDLGDLPENLDFGAADNAVDDLIAGAQRERPDLAAARADALKAQAHIRTVRSEGLPALHASGAANRTYYSSPTSGPFSTNYSGALQISVPLFTGFRNTYDTLEAREQAKAAGARLESLRQQVILEVWTSYFDLKTAGQRVQTARDLLDSAKQSQEVALGRYKNGVGSILDLLTAQSALASARAQEVQARSDWFLAVAQLAHDTGILGPPAGPPPSAPKKKETP
ncbi:MAG: TolC family protein [Thermoanaerobaculia bacterium]